MDGPVHGNLFVSMNRLKIRVKPKQRGTRGNNHGSHEPGDVLLGFPSNVAGPGNRPEIPCLGSINRTADFPGPGVIGRQRQGPRAEQVIQITQVPGRRDCGFDGVPAFIHVPVDRQAVHPARTPDKLPRTRRMRTRIGPGVKSAFDQRQVHQFFRQAELNKDLLD